MGLFALIMGLLTFPEYDKELHFAAGATVAYAAEYSGASPMQRCAISLGVGIAKETWDHYGHGDVEMADIAATTFGCGVTLNF